MNLKKLSNRGSALTSTVMGAGIIAFIVMMAMKVLKTASVEYLAMERFEIATQFRKKLKDYTLHNEIAWNSVINYSGNLGGVASMECLVDGTINCCHFGPANVSNPNKQCESVDPVETWTPNFGHFTVFDDHGKLYYDAKNPSAGFTNEGQPCTGFKIKDGTPECPWRVDLIWEAACDPPECRLPEVKITGKFLYSDGQITGVYTNEEAYKMARQGVRGLDFSGLRVKEAGDFVMAFTQSTSYSDPDLNGTDDNKFNVPYGTQFVMVEAWGAGGGGASGKEVILSDENDLYLLNSGVKVWPRPIHRFRLAGGGGGGGSYMKAIVQVTGGDIISVRVGRGGLAGASDGSTNGGRGGYSGFNVIKNTIDEFDDPENPGSIVHRIKRGEKGHVVAYGGQGGLACDSVVDEYKLCTDTFLLNGLTMREGDGGVSGFEGFVPGDLGYPEPRQQWMKTEWNSISLGKKGGRFNTIFNQYFYYYQYDPKPGGVPDNEWRVEFFGGPGGDAGGSGGYGGQVGLVISSEPTHPGGGGAGSITGKTPQAGEHGKVVVWF